MSSSTDNVRTSATPSVWRVGPLTVAGILMGLVDLAFCLLCLSAGKYWLGLSPLAPRTLSVLTLVYGGEAIFCVAGERRRIWSSWPGRWLLLCSLIDLTIMSSLAITGCLMAPLPLAILACVFGAAIVFALVLDSMKVLLFRLLGVA